MSEESLLDYFREDFALFIEAGFVAVKQLDEIAARRLFKAAELLHPDNPASQLGLGYIALHKLQVNEAAKIFEGILKKDPEHYLAQALAWHLLHDDQEQAQKRRKAHTGCQRQKATIRRLRIWPMSAWNGQK